MLMVDTHPLPTPTKKAARVCLPADTPFSPRKLQVLGQQLTVSKQNRTWFRSCVAIVTDEQVLVGAADLLAMCMVSNKALLYGHKRSRCQCWNRTT